MSNLVHSTAVNLNPPSKILFILIMGRAASHLAAFWVFGPQPCPGRDQAGGRKANLIPSSRPGPFCPAGSHELAVEFFG